MFLPITTEVVRSMTSLSDLNEFKISQTSYLAQAY
jgi:hypothetical protein